jgi:type I restriction enzyme S subunit
VTSGYPFESESYLTSGHYKLITIKNIQDDGINLVVNNFIETLPSNLPEYCKLKDGDILMSLTGNVGRVGLMYDNSCLLNQRVAIINPSKEAIRSYVYFLFKSDSLRMTMERIATGSAQKNLSPVSTELLNIPYDNVVAEKYSMIIDSAMKEMVLRLKENYELIRLRDFLLPLLMNGQVVINE